MSYRLSAIALLTLASTGCVTLGKPDVTRAIEIEDRAMGYAYKQDGKLLGQNHIAEALQSHPATARQMEGYSTKVGAGMVLGAVGGGLIGWNVGSNLSSTSGEKKTWTLALVGGAILVAAIPLGVSADRQIHGAVQSFNGSLVPPAPRTSLLRGLEPTVDVIRDGRGARQVLVGFGLPL